MIIAIDPGISTGWCHITPAGILACGRGEDFIPSAWGQKELTAVIEDQEVYPQTPASQANNLITLAHRVGRYQERLESRGPAPSLVLPKLWKGQVKKPVHHARMYTKLTSVERKVVDAVTSKIPEKATEDVLDAVCLALWKLGRLPKSGQST